MNVIITAVICTHNRSRYLIKAIQSLVNQHTSKDKYEIIVVDNRSTDSTKEVVERFTDKSNIRYIYEPNLGLSYARNTGWRNASGKYVAYLDDDAIACPGWLDKILEVFETVTPRPGCVGGRVEPIWESSRPGWLSDWLLHGLTIVDWSDTPHVLTNLSAEWLVGANIAFPVEVLEQVGGLTLCLGRIGKNLLSGEEVFLEKQILKAGYSCFYHPEIAVRHHILKSRLEKRWFIRRYYSQGISDAIMQLLRERPSTLKRLRFAVSQAKILLQSPRKVKTLILPTNDPDRFTQKCFSFITLGHIYGLLRVAKVMTTNIHLIRTRRPHWGKFSGINQFLKYIDHNKYHVDVYIASDNDEDFPIKNRTVCKWLRYLIQRKGMQYYKLSDLVAEIRVLRKCFRNKVDVIHYMDGEHSAQYLSWLCKLPRNVRPKVVATYHQPPEILNSLTNKRVISMLDHVTVVSPEQISYFQELLPPDKISMILHGIDVDFFRPGSKPKSGNTFRCITVGHWLRDFKAIREVAEKLAAYKDIEFHVVTSNLTGPRLTGLEGLTNVILYRDTIDDAGLLEQYQQSDILFLPLLNSTANNALLEGIACGLPVVSTYLPSVKAYLPGNEAILIKDNDPKQFIEVILRLSHTPEDAKNMAREARKRAEALDWRNIAPQYEAVYSNLTGK